MISGLSFILPKSVQQGVESRFEKPVVNLPKKKIYELPAFDAVRASTNLMVAGILISIATSYKLPLSTTYVTFMVAMGTSLADRAWGRESAVYRVAGVLNVIGGWFFTALSAFVAASLMAYVLFIGGGYALVGLFVLAIFLLAKNYLTHRKKTKEQREEDHLERAESSSTQGVIHESAKNIYRVVKRTNRIYTNSVEGLAKQELSLLTQNKATP